MFDWQAAAADLRHWVSGYWHVVDARGRHGASPIRTAPSVGTILTLYMGNSNRCANGTVTPTISELGPQRRVRTWYSQPGTELVMAVLNDSILVTEPNRWAAVFRERGGNCWRP